MDNFLGRELAFETKAIHGGEGERSPSGALEGNICQTATFRYKSMDAFNKALENERKGKAHIYTRTSNPSADELERCVALLEGGEKGVATASGSGAISSTLWTLLKKGDHVITAQGMYFFTERLFKNTMIDVGIEVSFVDATNIEEISNAVKENTKVLYIESPLNPSTRLIDIEKCAEIAHKNNIIVVVDSTFAPPPIQTPLKLGADIVIHSLTKYYNGHGDAVGGIIVGKEDLMWDIRLKGVCCSTGASISPNNAWLIRRGIKTMKLRVEKHCSNALKIAQFLEKHPYVEYVSYPALESHPDYELCKKQMHGLGSGIVTFKLKDCINGVASNDASRKLLNNLSICSVAVSLGEADTLITPESDVEPGLIRIAVGLEDADDLIADLKNALESI